MILIGMYDSPFVRRVAIALRLYGMAFEHRPWSVFRDAEKVAEYNPLIRVPTLVMDDGEVLVESSAILDALDDIVGPERALIPAGGPQRRLAMKIIALATGAADKTVSLIYERNVHKRVTPEWVARCQSQINAALDVVEADRAARETPYWFGQNIGHTDIAVAAAIRLMSETVSDVIDVNRWPAIALHCERCEAREEFREISQPFFASSPKS